MTKHQIHHYLLLAYRIAILYVLMSLTRIIFYAYNASLFPDVSSNEFFPIFFGGLRFDTTAIIYLNCVYILMNIVPFRFVYNSGYQKFAKWIYIVTNSVGLLANLADVVYYPFTLKRTTSLVFAQFSNEENMLPLIGQFLIDWWYMVLLFVAFVALLIFLYDRFSTKQPVEQNWKFLTCSIVAMCVVLMLCFGGIRGGFGHSTRPISPSDAGEYVNHPNEMAIVQNTPFTLIRTIGKTAYSRMNYFSEDEAESYFSIHHTGTQGEMKKCNVVIFILESWGREHVGFLNRDIPNYRGFTPFVDSLMEHSLVFKYAFANGRKSIDAIPSVLASIPFMKNSYVLSHYSSNKTCSLPQCLAQEGYYSAFFHGAPNGSMGFQSFTHLIGFDDYFGKTEYNNDADFDGIWGIWDEEFFQFYAEKMNSFTEPFITSVFSLSSHHPFKVPERYKGVFPKGEVPLQECIAYTDHAIRQFFAYAKQQDWYNNTLFVFTADHSSVGALEEYKNIQGKFAIPLFFFKPDNSLQRIDTTTIAQQIDIMPTILSYLNYSQDFCAFGKNLFDTTQTQAAVSYADNIAQCFYKDFVLQFDEQKSINMYNFKTDKLFKKNIVNTGVAEQTEMENYLKAFIQNYTNRMIDNTLCE